MDAVAIQWRFTRKAVAVDAGIMLLLGTILFLFEPGMTNPTMEKDSYRVGIALTALCLVLAGTRLNRLISGASKKSRLLQLLLMESLIACWVALWIMRGAPLDLRIILLLAGLHGILWGVWLLNLALQLRKLAIKAAMISILAATTSAAGLIIAAQSSLTTTTAFTVMACYTTYVGLELISLEWCLYLDLDETDESPSRGKDTADSDAILHHIGGT